jgi:hypothetical protein
VGEDAERLDAAVRARPHDAYDSLGLFGMMAEGGLPGDT